MTPIYTTKESNLASSFVLQLDLMCLLIWCVARYIQHHLCSFVSKKSNLNLIMGKQSDKSRMWAVHETTDQAL